MQTLSQDQLVLLRELGPVLASLARTEFEQRKKLKMLERQKQQEIEVIEAKQQSEQSTNGIDVESLQQTATTTATPSDDWFEDSLQTLKDKETCDICMMILESIEDVPVEDRAQAIAEYGQFKQSLSESKDESEVRELLYETDVLIDVVRDEFNLAPQ